MNPFRPPLGAPGAAGAPPAPQAPPGPKVPAARARRAPRYIPRKRSNATVTPAPYHASSEVRLNPKNGTAMRKGFTLVEVLVILAILAALAAVLVPTVSNQVRKADVGRVTGDLTNLRSGVEAFLVNVHRYPGDIEDLVYPVAANDAGTDADVSGSAYTTGLASKWEGPYVDRVIVDEGSLETGFGGEIQDNFTSTTDGGIEYLTVAIHGIAQAEFDLIDAQIDEGNGTTAGRLRWTAGATATDPDVIHFYALPIN